MKKIQGNSMVNEPGYLVTPIRSIQWGLMAGLAGTLAMDLAMAGGLSAMGLPAGTCYLTIGSTVTRFFFVLGIKLTGDLTLGLAAYHLIGPLLGALYGLIVSQSRALQWATMKKHLFYAVLYAEIISQMILTLMPILLRMPAQEALLWYAGSSVLHGIWGIVMGMAAYYWLRVWTRKSVQSEAMGEI